MKDIRDEIIIHKEISKLKIRYAEGGSKAYNPLFVNML